MLEEVEEAVVEEEVESLDTLHPLEYLDSSLVHSTQVRKGKFHSIIKFEKQGNFSRMV